MNPNDDRTTRWIAHILGDLDSAESAAVEAEMRDEPEAAEELRRVVKATRDWAKEPVAHAPVDVAALTREARGPEKLPRRRLRLATALPWALAASLLIIVATQASVRATVAGTTFAWGDDPAPNTEIVALEAELTALNESYIELANENLLFYDQFDEVLVGLQQLETQLHLTATELAANQQRESQTRYADMQRLLQIAGFTRAAMPRAGRPIATPAAYTDQP